MGDHVSIVPPDFIIIRKGSPGPHNTEKQLHQNAEPDLLLISKPDRTKHEMPFMRSTYPKLPTCSPSFKDKRVQGVDICQDRIEKFIKWQGSIFAKLFPTKAMKKRFGQK